MKLKYYFLPLAFFMLFEIFVSELYSQGIMWDRAQRVTSGYVDRNPSFDTKYANSCGIKGFTFLVFERVNSLSNSDICVIKFNFDSAFGGVKYLTNNSKINRNPKISWNSYNYLDSVSIALVVWETVENNRVNIYGCSYSNYAWSLPFSIDTGAGIKANPKVNYSSGQVFSIVYENSGDIIFKQIDVITHNVSNSFNLTSTDTSECKSPCVSSSNSNPKYLVFYQRQKPNREYAIYYKKATSSFDWTGDSVTTVGNNIHPEIASSFLNAVVFESKRNEKYAIFSYVYSYNIYQIYYNPSFNYSNFQNYFFPMITKVYSLFQCVLRQSNDYMKLMFGFGDGQFLDSMIVSDTSHKPVVTMGNGIFPPQQTYPYQMVWTVYNKDSAGFSMLYALGKNIYITDIRKTGEEIPGNYNLSQNYPNPFNPSTNIKFQIPENSFIKISIYDNTGKEIETLVNDNLSAGEYEVKWDAGKYSSGVYYYRLQSGDFQDTKRMVLLK